MKRITFPLMLLIAPLALAGPWPTDDITTTHLDAATDDPSQARPELYTGLLRIKDIIAARGAASGVASLDSGTKVPIAQIPTGSGGVQAYDSDLNCVAGLSSSGLMARTGTGTCAVRTLGVGTGMTISNANGVSGDPSIALSSNLQSWSGKTAPSGTVAGTTDTQTLTNKTLTAPVLSGTVTGTYTIGGTPTFPATVVSTTGAQTLTNKTLTAPTINGTITGITVSESQFAAITAGTTYTLGQAYMMRAYGDNGSRTGYVYLPTQASYEAAGAVYSVNSEPLEFYIPRAGTYRITATIYNASGGDTTTVRVLTNGATGSSSTTVTGTTPTARTFDLSLNGGDFVNIQYQNDNGPSYIESVKVTYAGSPLFKIEP